METYHEAQLLAGYVIDVLRQNGDIHSTYLETFKVDNATRGDIMGNGRKVMTRYLGDGVGYISMPGFASVNDSIRIAFATSVQELIKKTDTENKVCSWIIDLRDDNGGSAPPMILGLGPILGDGIYDTYVKRGTSQTIHRNGRSFSVLKAGRGW